MARRRGATKPKVSNPANEPEGDDRMVMFKEWFKTDRDQSHDWRIEARTCYGFVAGPGQWDENDKEILRLANRPVITFNRTGSVVDSVAGLEVSNRQEVQYIPRQVGASGVNDLLTAAGKWIRDECNAEDEESDPFVDLIICGEGCTETRIDYDEDPQGKMAIIRVDPLEMFWDATARRRNRSDGKRVFRVRDVPVNEAEAEFPGYELNELDAQWAKDPLSEAKSPHDAMDAPYYRHDQSPDIDKRTKKITLVEIQWWEHEKGHRVVDPETGTAKVLSPDDFSKLKTRMATITDLMAASGMPAPPPLESTPTKKRVYKRAILGAKVLKEWDGPKEGGFTYKCMTGKRDRNAGTWYGLVRAMIDPQKWANKWLSQVLHIINSNAKGGYWAEVDAFENPQEALETMADPSAITLLNPGTLEKGKLMPKQAVQYPEGIDRLMQFAISSIRDTTGVNLELLGMANKDQPGIIEAQRKQAGMTILAGLFDSLRHYRKEQGKLMLWYITNFLTDGRLVRIGGPENAQYVPLVHQPGLIEYDVIVDDTPSSPNQKEKTWAILVQMFPVLAKIDAPLPLWLTLLEYSPLPSSLIAKINQMMGEGQQNKPPDPKMIEAQGKVQAKQIESQAEMMRAQADVEVAHSQAQAANAKTMAEAQRAHHEGHATAHGAHVDANAKVIETLVGLMLQAQAQQADQALKERQANRPKR